MCTEKQQNNLLQYIVPKVTPQSWQKQNKLIFCGSFCSIFGILMQYVVLQTQRYVEVTLSSVIVSPPQ